VTVLVNDTEAGWAGSLACGAGINLVSGTGSIAYGKNESGQAMRSGGWSEVFGDEGSSYWLGIKCMQLFSKQADGREKKDALYNLVRERYPMKTDFEFAVMAHRDWLPHRDKVAQFQTLLSDAADAGDVMAREMYEQAAAELAQLAVAVKAGLHFHDAAVTVSYSGGTFRAGEKLLMPLGRWLQQEGMVLRKPILTPVEGAVLLAVSACPQHSVAGVCAGLQRDAAL
ncbi:MAG: BadF/BadG/BcrA/BcrD ATPase family protein, partial [Ruthenibacterium sp.]